MIHSITIKINTKKGPTEAAVAYEYVPRTFWDRILGRERVLFGVGLCSPRDFAGSFWKATILSGNVIRAELTPTFVPGRTEWIARGRLMAYADDGRRRTFDRRLAGTIEVGTGGFSWFTAHDLISRAAPRSWGVTKIDPNCG